MGEKGGVRVRDFIYLDLNRVNSIIAQSESGLVTSIRSTAEATAKTQKDIHLGGTSDTAIAGKIAAIIKAEEDLGLSADYEKQVSKERLSNQIKEISIHDAAFDIAFEYMKTSLKRPSDVLEIGDYFELEDEFRFIDMDFLESLFGEDGFVSWLKENEIKQLKTNVENSLTREQQRNKDYKKVLQQSIRDKESEYADYEKTIKAIKKILPFKRMLVSSKGFIIPLHDNYFRDQPQTSSFKYGGVITAVGTITNRIETNNLEETGNKDMFSMLYDGVYSVLKGILEITNDTIHILNPVAVYYNVRENNDE